MYIIHVVLIRRPIYVLLTIFEQSLDFFINSLQARVQGGGPKGPGPPPPRN